MNTLLLWGQQHSILLMVGWFLVILATMYWPGRRETVERHGRIPLQDDP
jgi:cbb3-type cytochrome oxidase subunit 3